MIATECNFLSFFDMICKSIAIALASPPDLANLLAEPMDESL